LPLRFHLNPTSRSQIQERIGDKLARNLAAANLLGRVQIVKHAHKKSGRIIPINAGTRLGQHRQFDDGDSVLYGSFSTDLPNDDAADYIADLTPVTKEIFNGLTAQYKSAAFTLAAAADVRLIEKIRDALAQVAKDGGTAQDFEQAVNRITDDAGVAELNAFTLDTAFNTAMQKAYSLGRYEQMSDAATIDVLPVWQYWTVGDDRVRPEHAVLDGFAAHAQDPVWHKIYPPNGFNCRCSVIPLLASEAPKDANEPGYARLPMLAVLKVPQPGFGKVFNAAA
jgi:SPP1 gp7 family putative phage head morphogenesis protein